MTALLWDQAGQRTYETGVDKGVLYIPNALGVYDTGVAWNGLTTVTESPSGAEANKQYADNRVYANLLSAEQFGGTIEAFTYPPEFGQCNGTASPTPGVAVGQQTRKSFGFSYRTRLGNDLEDTEYGYKIHLVYGAKAAPSEMAYATINDSPEAITMSWEITTDPVDVPGTNPETGKPYKPTATLTIVATVTAPGALVNTATITQQTEVDPNAANNSASVTLNAAESANLRVTKALTRFRIDWTWNGGPALLQSRVIDETGYVQPTIRQLRTVRGTRSIYHNNAIQTWRVDATGEVSNVQVL